MGSLDPSLTYLHHQTFGQSHYASLLSSLGSFIYSGCFHSGENMVSLNLPYLPDMEFAIFFHLFATNVRKVTLNNQCLARYVAKSFQIL